MVVTYNRLDKLKDTIAALLAAAPEHLHHLLVVDNASSDGTAQWLATLDDPRLEVLRLKTNTGGAGGFEAGLRHLVWRHDPDWIAMDLFSQAEHDEQAQSILISPDAEFLDAVEASINNLLPTMERADIIRTSMTDRAALIHVTDLKQAAEVSNRIAPEHLELSVEDPEAMLEDIRHAGAIFMGRYTAEALGDYCAGPNHVLPTSGTARFSSPLGVYDFQKRSSIIGFSAAGADRMGRVASVLARGEGLTAHARSAEYRIKD